MFGLIGLRRALIVGGFAVLAVVATLGWTRKSEPVAAFPVPASQALAPMPSDSVTPATPVVYANSPYAPPFAAPAPSAAAQAPAQVERRAARTSAVESRQPRVVTRKRPFSHSAAIVGGSAGAGAAIGALARRQRRRDRRAGRRRRRLRLRPLDQQENRSRAVRLPYFASSGSSTRSSSASSQP